MKKQSKITQKGYAYFDTNIFGILASNLTLLPYLRKFLDVRNLVIILSEIQAVELSEHIEYMADDFLEIMYKLPVIISKPAITLFEEELEAYPNERNLPLEHPILNSFPEMHFSLLLKSPKLKKSRQNQKKDASKVHTVLEKYRHNFPIDENKSLESQAELFAHHITSQYLFKNFPETTVKIWNKYKNIDVQVFKTNQIQGYVNFYRYYIDNETPSSHDHADSWHLSYLPYCKFAIMEQRICSILNRIQNKNNRFTNVKVRDNRWLEKKLPNR